MTLHKNSSRQILNKINQIKNKKVKKWKSEKMKKWKKKNYAFLKIFDKFEKFKKKKQINIQKNWKFKKYVEWIQKLKTFISKKNNDKNII